MQTHEPEKKTWNKKREMEQRRYRNGGNQGREMRKAGGEKWRNGNWRNGNQEMETKKWKLGRERNGNRCESEMENGADKK